MSSAHSSSVLTVQKALINLQYNWTFYLVPCITVGQ